MNEILQFVRARNARIAFDKLEARAASEAPPLKAKSAAKARAVLWVYRDYEDRWCVRKEGGEVEAAFAERLTAVELARTIGQAAGSYHIFLELKDGRVIEEHFGVR